VLRRVIAFNLMVVWFPVQLTKVWWQRSLGLVGRSMGIPMHMTKGFLRPRPRACPGNRPSQGSPGADASG
jgi:hypothetical protein